MPLLDTRHKKKSFTLTTILLSALLLILFYIGLTYMDPPIENGIAINFGTMDFGSGKEAPRPKRTPQPVKQQEPVPVTEPSQPVSDAPTEKVLTQETEESIRINQERERKRKVDEAARKAKAEAQRKADAKRRAEEEKRKAQEAKKKSVDALIGGIGKAEGKSDSGEGDDTKSGDKGSPDGDPYAATYYGQPGSGDGGKGYGLRGRSLSTRGKVQQECNEDGKVVVKIFVDRQGRVIKAIPGVKGTTNNAPCLLEPARKTAMMYKWNPDSKAPTSQEGHIEVNFKLGQ
ncbi:MAG: energy transducer TonB [Bacteroidota bacterium]